VLTARYDAAPIPHRPAIGKAAATSGTMTPLARKLFPLGVLAAIAGACSKEQALESGAKVLQNKEPIDQISMYLVGFHPMKDMPQHAMEAHHFCNKVNPDFTQCVLFDGRGKDAKLNGIEYIVSEKVFETLSPDERKFWHPHNHEIMSGQLVMPGIPNDVEHEAMKTLVNSYGKTWHVWSTGGPGSAPDALPLGTPRLAWSYNAEGEAPMAMIEERDRKLDVNTEEKRKNRQDLLPLLHCQEGVDALASAFPGRKMLPGICDKQAAPAPL